MAKRLTSLKKSISELRKKADIRERVLTNIEQVRAMSEGIANLGKFYSFKQLYDLRHMGSGLDSNSALMKQNKEKIKEFKEMDPVYKTLFLIRYWSEDREIEKGLEKDAKRSGIELIDGFPAYMRMQQKAEKLVSNLLELLNERRMGENVYQDLLKKEYEKDILNPWYKKIDDWFKSSKNKKQIEQFGGPCRVTY